MRNIHLPIWLNALGLPRAIPFAALFTCEGFFRAILITVIPLKAHALLGDAQKVSVLYFAISIAGLIGSLGIPWLVRCIRRRWVFTVGTLCLGAATALFTGHALPTLIAGMALLVFGSSCLEITLNLYLLDHIGRREISRFEPVRVFFTAGAWTLGPWLGIYLANRVAPWAPFAVVGAGAVVMLAGFWYVRLSENPAIAAATRHPPNPVHYLPRFFAQPRLRLAWFLAAGRTAWWSMFFIYAPIYMVTAGIDAVVSGAIVSLGTGALFLVPVWGWLGQRHGLRRLLIGGYGVTGVVTLAVAAVAGVPWLGAAMLVGAAMSASVVDGAGNTPFLRAVHPLERADMTTVYGTFRYAAQLGPPGLYSVLLSVFPLPAVFVAGSAMMGVLAFFARYLPRRL